MLSLVALAFVLLWNVWMVCREGVAVIEIRGTVIRKEALQSNESLDLSESNQHSGSLAVMMLSKSISTSVPISTNKDLIDSSTNKSVDPSDTVSDSIPDSVSGLPPRLSPAIILPMNGNSSYVHSDITNITHVPSKTRIEVHLHKSSNRRCQNPFFRGRLSGLSLSSINFEFEDNSAHVLVGVYDRSSLPVSGTYYLEIIILLCERYSEEYVLNNTTKNLANVCLESPVGGTHRITQSNASVQIKIEEEEKVNFPFVAGPKGRWLHKSLVETNTNANNPRNTVPLYTRFIPKECHGREESAFCRSVHGVSRFQRYTYRWSDGPQETLNRPGIRPVLETYGQNSTANSRIVEPHLPTNVCFLGASHAYVLVKHCQVLLSQSPDISNMECQHMSFKEPNDIKESSILALLENRQRCTHVVIGLFQWPFSYHHSTIHFSDWKREMTTVVEMFKSAVASPKNALEKILLRSAHTNAMGYKYHTCPARDYRTIPNAKMATSFLKEIVETHAIDEDGKEVLSLVDTTFLLDPVWDSAPDLSHYTGEAALMETKYILWKILSER